MESIASLTESPFLNSSIIQLGFRASGVKTSADEVRPRARAFLSTIFLSDLTILILSLFLFLSQLD